MASLTDFKLRIETISLLHADGRHCGQDMEGSVWQALDRFKIELPSWGFANTGTRFGKFVQPAAATNIAEKFSDAGMVNQLTGACPTVALHGALGLAEWTQRCFPGKRAVQ